ncbi:HAD family hydrolase [Winogradskya consettensis]|uniref:HAD family hydrolase n=1 Tax=Winogradskya consettensis TaxID=113560 RepID=UPI0031D292FB
MNAGAQALLGARDLARSLHGRVPIAVASNNPRAFVTTALVSAGLDNFFTHMYAAEDVTNPKPAPDLHLTACAALNADPTRSIAFEDSPTGVAAARAAAMHVVGVPSLPGVTLAADTIFPSLTHPTLTHWATTVA